MKYRIGAVLLFLVALLTTLGWTTASWGQAKIARVGILHYTGTTRDTLLERWSHRTLQKHGWVEDKNISFQYSDVRNNPQRFAEAAADFVG